MYDFVYLRASPPLLAVLLAGWLAGWLAGSVTTSGTDYQGRAWLSVPPWGPRPATGQWQAGNWRLETETLT